MTYVNGRPARAGSYRGSRWCDEHQQFHGPLYSCETYPEEVLQEIADNSARFATNLLNEQWCREQIAKGVPLEAILIWRAPAGL